MDQEGKEEYTEFLNLIKIFISMLSENGKLITKMGEIEKRFPNEFQMMKEFSPERLDAFVGKAPPEIAGLFLKIMLRAAAIGPRTSRAMELPAEEKLELGKQMNELVKDLEILLKKVEEESQK
jgi:hypothetical protein